MAQINEANNWRLMCTGGKSILSLSDRGLLMMFFPLQGTNSPCSGQSLYLQCWAVYLLFHMHLIHRFLREAELLSQQKIHHLQVNTNKTLVLIITMFSSTYFTALYFSLCVVKWARGTTANRLPLWSRAILNLWVHTMAFQVCAELLCSKKNKNARILHAWSGKSWREMRIVREEVLFLQFGYQ